MTEVRKGRDYWRGVVRRYRRGSRTAAEFAEAEGVKLSTLRYWIWKLGSLAETVAPPVELIPVEVTGRVLAEQIAISIGAVTVRLPRGTDVAYVAMLVRELGRVC